MEARSLWRPLSELVSGRSQSLLCLSTPSSRRHESTYKRTKRALNIGPDPSFLPSKSSPQKGTHIIFNPPSSAASIYHTPLKFLPKSDPRLKLFSSVTSAPPPTRLPPLIYKKSGLPVSHISEADMREIQRLRREDPVKNTTRAMARKFGCSTNFVVMLSSTLEKDAESNTAAWRREQDRRLREVEAVRARWGDRRRMAREDRLKRREMVLRDE